MISSSGAKERRLDWNLTSNFSKPGLLVAALCLSMSKLVKANSELPKHRSFGSYEADVDSFVASTEALAEKYA